MRDFIRVIGISLSLMACEVVLASSTLARAASTTPQPKAVLLVSLDPDLYPKGIASWFHHYNRYPEELEKIFLEGFKLPGYETVVVQNADLYDLYQILHSDDVDAVFWVSHEAAVSWSEKPGIKIDPLLVDSELADVKTLFREVNPHIKWVSLISCDSQLVIDWLGTNSANRTKFQGFNQVIDAKRGLRTSMEKAQEFLSSVQEEASDSPVDGYPVKVTRELSTLDSHADRYFPAVGILVGDRVIGAFPHLPLSSDQTEMQTQVIYLRPEDTNGGIDQVRIEIFSGLDVSSLPKNFALGSFSAASLDSGGQISSFTWLPFRMANGQPFGVTRQILRAVGVNSISP